MSVEDVLSGKLAWAVEKHDIGTTGVAARRLGRRVVGFDASEVNVKMARERIVGDLPLFNREEETAQPDDRASRRTPPEPEDSESSPT